MKMKGYGYAAVLCRLKWRYALVFECSAVIQNQKKGSDVTKTKLIFKSYK